VIGIIRPPPLLDARYGNVNLGVPGNENAQIQNAVLLGPQEFLSIEKEYGLISVIQKSEVSGTDPVSDTSETLALPSLCASSSVR